MSAFYDTNPADPMAPVPLTAYRDIWVGEMVYYTGPMPLPGLHIVTELLRWPGQDEWVMAILNDGEYEVNADLLGTGGTGEPVG